MSKAHKVTVPGHEYPTPVAHGRYAIVDAVCVVQQAKTEEAARKARARYPQGYRIYDLVEGVWLT